MLNFSDDDVKEYVISGYSKDPKKAKQLKSYLASKPSKKATSTESPTTRLVRLAKADVNVAVTVFKNPKLLSRESDILLKEILAAHLDDLEILNLAMQHLKEKFSSIIKNTQGALNADETLSSTGKAIIMFANPSSQDFTYFFQDIKPLQLERNKNFILANPSYSARLDKESIGYIFSTVTDEASIFNLSKSLLENNRDFIAFIDDVAETQAGIKRSKGNETYETGVAVLQKALYKPSNFNLKDLFKTYEKTFERLFHNPKRPSFLDSSSAQVDHNLQLGNNIVPLYALDRISKKDPEKHLAYVEQETIQLSKAGLFPIEAFMPVACVMMEKRDETAVSSWKDKLKNGSSFITTIKKSLTTSFSKQSNLAKVILSKTATLFHEVFKSEAQPEMENNSPYLFMLSLKEKLNFPNLTLADLFFKHLPYDLAIDTREKNVKQTLWDKVTAEFKSKFQGEHFLKKDLLEVVNSAQNPEELVNLPVDFPFMESVINSDEDISKAIADISKKQVNNIITEETLATKTPEELLKLLEEKPFLFSLVDNNTKEKILLYAEKNQIIDNEVVRVILFSYDQKKKDEKEDTKELLDLFERNPSLFMFSLKVMQFDLAGVLFKKDFVSTNGDQSKVVEEEDVRYRKFYSKIQNVIENLPNLKLKIEKQVNCEKFIESVANLNLDILKKLKGTTTEWSELIAEIIQNDKYKTAFFEAFKKINNEDTKEAAKAMIAWVISNIDMEFVFNKSELAEISNIMAQLKQEESNIHNNIILEWAKEYISQENTKSAEEKVEVNNTENIINNIDKINTELSELKYDSEEALQKAASIYEQINEDTVKQFSAKQKRDFLANKTNFVLKYYVRAQESSDKVMEESFGKTDVFIEKIEKLHAKKNEETPPQSQSTLDAENPLKAQPIPQELNTSELSTIVQQIPVIEEKSQTDNQENKDSQKPELQKPVLVVTASNFFKTVEVTLESNDGPAEQNNAEIGTRAGRSSSVGHGSRPQITGRRPRGMSVGNKERPKVEETEAEIGERNDSSVRMGMGIGGS